MGIFGLGYGTSEGIQHTGVLAAAYDFRKPVVKNSGIGTRQLGYGFDPEAFEVAQHGRANGVQIGKLSVLEGGCWHGQIMGQKDPEGNSRRKGISSRKVLKHLLIFDYEPKEWVRKGFL